MTARDTEMSFEPTWDERGLCPAIVQEADSGAVLMMAWMNAEALRLTRETGDVTFWSRSRQAMWRKGEISGNTLRLVELRLDCDGDTMLVRARAAGPACHTGKPTCFFTVDGAAPDDGLPLARPIEVLPALERVLISRRDDATAEKSYTRSLLDAGYPKILAKIAEEHGELAAELPAGTDDAVIHETADLFFHVFVGLVARGLSLDDVWRELGRRFGVGGHEEKASR